MPKSASLAHFALDHSRQIIDLSYDSSPLVICLLPSSIEEAKVLRLVVFYCWHTRAPLHLMLIQIYYATSLRLRDFCKSIYICSWILLYFVVDLTSLSAYKCIRQLGSYEKNKSFLPACILMSTSEYFNEPTLLRRALPLLCKSFPRPKFPIEKQLCSAAFPI